MPANKDRIGHIGEFPLIESLFHRQRTLPEDVRTGIGDDAAVLAAAGDDDWVAAVDTVTEGIHAIPGDDAAAFGWKAVAVNVSDLAAMGATPRHALVAASLPTDLATERAEAVADGLHAALAEWGVTLVGGDTVAARGGPLSLSVTLLGRAAKGASLRRSGARPGDTVYVTGTLGDSAAGLVLLSEPPSDWLGAYDWLVARHRRPRPPLVFGRGIAGAASAAIDVSDGLVADLGHIAAASQVGIELDADRLPLSAPMGEWAWAAGIDPERYALTGGEDFELAFTAGGDAFEALQRAKYTTDTRFTVVGRVVAERPGAVFGPGVPADGGWEHFAPEGQP
ncbi:thiamine-phosphate kinase [Thiohalorhabdus sp.]|uniref:thiamine-phosphate kinase n=2 Tax=Thiohalorhabdus sp. TaxID=3094134 RepID=UPI002FC2D924